MTGVTVPAVPNTVTAPPLVGAADTFWNWPEVMIAGLTWSCRLPPALEVYAPVVELYVPALGVPTNGRTTNWRSLFAYTCRFCGLTAKQPAKLTTSPTFRTFVLAVQPVVRIRPVCDQPLVMPWPAPETVGVPP